MKHTIFLLVLAVLGCSKQQAELTPKEKAQIKAEIITSYEKHADDIRSLNFVEVANYYANVEDHIFFADGFYAGNYQTIDAMWKWVADNVKQIYLWESDKHHVYIFSENTAMYLFEFYSERIQMNGDTVKVQGAFSHGMQKFADEWKIVATLATHNYVEGYEPR